MAKRSQTGGTMLDHNTTSYEDFQPLAERGEDKENNFWTVHLPGFKKEQINITCVRSVRTIRLQGEGQLANNKGRRLNQSFSIKQDCNLDKIQAKWLNEVLTIIMPKLHPSTQVAKQESDQKMKKEQAPSPVQAAAAEDQQKPSQQSQNLKQEQVAPSSQDAAAKDQKKSLEESQKLKQEQALQQDKYQEKTLQQESQKMKQPELTPPLKAAAAAASTSTASQKPHEKEPKPQKGQEETLPQLPQVEELKKAESNVVPKGITSTTSDQKEKEKITKKDDKSGDASKAKNLKEAKSLTDVAMKAVKGLSMENKEDKQTIINISVAVIVLAVLGAYVSYSLGSKSKEK